MTFYQLRALFASLNIAPLPTSDWEEAGGYCLDAPTLLPGGGSVKGSTQILSTIAWRTE